MQRPIRYLVPWLEQAEAVAVLLGGHLPGPTDNVQPHIETYQRMRIALDARRAYAIVPEALQQIPLDLQDKTNAFIARPDVQNGLHGLDWTVGVVDLTDVLSFQKAVILEQVDDRVASATDGDWNSLFSVCLPNPRVPQDLATMIDPDGKAFTLSSLDPNLRIAGHVIQDINVAPMAGQLGQNMKFLGFPITFGTPFIQISEYRGRRFVRDGYHRCYGLLKKGIRRIPCVLTSARSFAEVGANGPSFFSQETLLGDWPPFLRDFLDNEVSAETEIRATRKVVRIQAQEFNVEI